MTKLLFLCKRFRPDILTGVTFLTTRVRDPNKDDNNKLSRTLKYLSSTKDLVLTLESVSTRTVKWWVGTAFLVHHDMKSHTGGIMLTRKGYLYSAAKKIEHEELN